MLASAHPVGWRDCFPGLTGTRDGRVSIIEQGWDFRVVRVGDLAVRLPRRAEVESHARVEGRLLPEVAAFLPIRIPQPVEVCPVHGSMAYPWIPGDPISSDLVEAVGTAPLSEQLAGFLDALHRFPRERAGDLGVGQADHHEQLERFQAHVLPVLGHRPPAARLLDEARDLLRGYELRLVHGDLGPAHLVCDDEGLAAVIDWADAALGDPAQDVAWILNGFARRLRGPFLATHPLDDEVVARADVLHRLGPWWEVLYGLDHGRRDLVESGMAGVETRLAPPGRSPRPR